jgi:predicted amidohydrolase YtcJ
MTLRRLILNLLLPAALILALAGSAGPPSVDPADVLYLHGGVFTQDAARTTAEAVAIRGGRIVYVGTDAGAGAFRGPRTRVVDLTGKMLLPGFHDSHVHPVEGGLALSQCNLSGLESREAVFDAIRKYAAAHPGTSWIVGSGWELPLFPEANPTRQELDAVVADRPAYFSAADGHSAWVNTRALEVAGITRQTPDPDNGRIERDADGNPSGTLRESAERLVSSHIPPPTAADEQDALRRGLALANRFGITSFIEARATPQILAAYATLARASKLTARVVASLAVDPARGQAQVAELAREREANTIGRLRPIAAKIFADGVIESETAALLDPYLDRPGYRGRPNLEPQAFDRLAIALDRAGFQIHVHAIGDRAIRMALDALEAARKANGRDDTRPLIAHLELLEPEDIPRFRRLGVLADFQPLWAYEDSYIRTLTIPKLGKDRSRWLYPIGSVEKSGAIVVGGSDWPVTSMNPLEAIAVAVTRQDPDDPGSAPFIPEERVDLPDILAAYTINGAYASHEQKETGSIEVGKAADLVLLDRDLFEIPPRQIPSVRVIETVLEGRVVYRKGETEAVGGRR